MGVCISHLGDLFARLQQMGLSYVNRQSEMREPGAEVLAGRANSTSAIHYSMHMMDMMTKATIDGWKSFGIDILQEANQ